MGAISCDWGERKEDRIALTNISGHSKHAGPEEARRRRGRGKGCIDIGDIGRTEELGGGM